MSGYINYIMQKCNRVYRVFSVTFKFVCCGNFIVCFVSHLFALALQPKSGFGRILVEVSISYSRRHTLTHPVGLL